MLVMLVTIVSFFWYLWVLSELPSRWCSLSFRLVTFTFIFLMLQVNTCLPELFWLDFYYIVAFLAVEFWLIFAGPPKIDKNFFNDCDLIVSFSPRSVDPHTLLWWFSLLLFILADFWYRAVLLSRSATDLECILDCWMRAVGWGWTYLKKLAWLRLFYLPSLVFFIYVRIYFEYYCLIWYAGPKMNDIYLNWSLSIWIAIDQFIIWHIHRPMYPFFYPGNSS